MRVLVVYATRLGATQGIAERIATRLREANLEAHVTPAANACEIDGYDGVVVGSGVYAGRWLKEATEFVRRNREKLADRPVWLFSSGPVGTTATNHEPTEPQEIHGFRAAIHPRDHRVFAGALDRSKVDGADLGFAARLIAKRFVPEGDFRDWPVIDAWANEIANQLAVREGIRAGA